MLVLIPLSNGYQMYINFSLSKDPTCIYKNKTFKFQLSTEDISYHYIYWEANKHLETFTSRSTVAELYSKVSKNFTLRTPSKINHLTYLKRGLSVVTIPTSISDGLKSADNTDDRQLMAVWGNNTMSFNHQTVQKPAELQGWLTIL